MTSHTRVTLEFTGGAASGDLDFSDPALFDAVTKVQQTDGEISWMLVGYVSGQNKLQLVETGSGDLDDLAEEMDDSARVYYGYIRVTQGALQKFVFINWVGDGVPAVRKGVVVTGDHANIVARRLFKHFHVQVDARNQGDLDSKSVMARVKTAAGADYSAGEDKGLKTRK